jgi:sulfoxide reductase catalytic subunit YedY
MIVHFGITSLGFPLRLRVSHYIKLLFIGLLIRSGIQILGAHPRLYWNDGCDPGTEWMKFTMRKVPEHELYTSMKDNLSFSAYPFGRGVAHQVREKKE